MRSYPPLENRPEAPKMPVNIPSTQELKAKNKEGMPYSLLFDHGTREIQSEVLFAMIRFLR
jgi:hypothetical protein